MTSDEKKYKNAKATKRNKSANADAKKFKCGDGAVEDPLALDRFRLSQAVKAQLMNKGISSLFPIQARTFDLALDGCDVVGRAKTGSGKTLAFVLPIVERLMADRPAGHGRGPSVLCLTPTRELAKQVCAECAYIGKAAGLVSYCMYGSAPYHEQEWAMRAGIDILVGTPGRIKDHINRGNLRFSNLRYQILDECDQMLKMGFVEDVEFILNAVGNREHIQTLLFSATLPHWVKQLLRKFCKPDYKTVDLMTSQSSQATNCVRHKCVKAERFTEISIPDLIHCHANGARTIVFVDTKANCDKTSEALSGSLKARAIHGDLQQKTREATLEAFRKGQIDVLVATDVAARGLDIPEVGLVIQTSPPKDVESYIHRAGRTGRAERTGVCICVVSQSTEYLLRRIQQHGGIQFEWIQPPQMADMIQIATKSADETLRNVKVHKTELFKESAQEMLDMWKDPASLVASALACMTGYSKVHHRSLLLNLERHVTLQAAVPGTRDLSVEGINQTVMKTSNVEVKGTRLLEDGTGVVFDVEENCVEELLGAFGEASQLSLKVIARLPKLRFVPRPQYSQGSNRWNKRRSSTDTRVDEGHWNQRRSFGGRSGHSRGRPGNFGERNKFQRRY